jgi:ribosomal RNA assembly protein
VKSKIEQLCYVTLDIDGETGEVFIKTVGNVDRIQPFKAMEIVTAIGRGFSPEHAMNLLKGENALHVIDLRDFAGKSNTNIERIKGRIIGEGGKARKNLENLTGTFISVYGKTVSIIGDTSKLRLVVDAISSISSGSMHGAVYTKLEAANRKNKQEKMKLWENQDVFY